MGKKLRIGIVGLRFGQHVIETQIVHGPGEPFIELAGVCDMNAERASAAAAKYGVPAYTSIEALLAANELDVVGLFTPPHGRAGLIHTVIRAGKHVLTTKPFELDPEAALAVLIEAQRLGCVVHTNSPAPHTPPEMAQVLQWQQQYDLGAAVSAHAETWASYREVNDGTWFCDPVKCPAAPLLRLGVYCVNDLVSLFGAARRVQVMHTRIRTGRPTADNAQMLIEFGGGVIGSVFASFCIDDGNPYASATRVSYERGTIYCNVGQPTDERGQIHLQLVMRQGAKVPAVIERAVVCNNRRSSNYQWEALARDSQIDPADRQVSTGIVEGVAVLAAMAKSSVSGSAEAVVNLLTPGSDRRSTILVS